MITIVSASHENEAMMAAPTICFTCIFFFLFNAVMTQMMNVIMHPVRYDVIMFIYVLMYEVLNKVPMVVYLFVFVHYFFPKLVVPMRFELMAYDLEGRCSIQLSYGTVYIVLE